MPTSNQATLIYYGMLAAHGFIFYVVATINIIYQIELADLNPLQLVLIGTALEAAIFAFEIPTGVLADTISRKRSVIIGYVLIGLGFILEGAFPIFTTILIASAIWGVGHTFISGAREAWIADESQSPEAGKIFLRGEQLFQIFALFGMGVSVTLAALTEINIPVVVGGMLFVILGIILTFLMPEVNFQRTPREQRSSWRQLRETLTEGIKLVRITPVLLMILIISLVSGIASEGFDRLWQKHLLDNISLPQLLGLAPIYWFGLIFAVSMMLSVIGTEIARRHINTEQHLAVSGALMIINGLIGVFVIIYGFSHNFLIALLAYWIIMPLRHMAGPIYLAWLNQRAMSRVRATIFSLRSQADAIGQVLAAPVIGLIGLLISVPMAIVTAGLIWLLVLPFYYRAKRL